MRWSLAGVGEFANYDYSPGALVVFTGWELSECRLSTRVPIRLREFAETVSDAL